MDGAGGFDARKITCVRERHRVSGAITGAFGVHDLRATSVPRTSALNLAYPVPPVRPRGSRPSLTLKTTSTKKVLATVATRKWTTSPRRALRPASVVRERPGVAGWSTIDVPTPCVNFLSSQKFITTYSETKNFHHLQNSHGAPLKTSVPREAQSQMCRYRPTCHVRNSDSGLRIQ